MMRVAVGLHITGVSAAIFMAFGIWFGAYHPGHMCLDTGTGNEPFE